MTVLGFQEAVDTAQLVEVGEGLVVPVVSIPAFVLLKLMAWKDRRIIKNTDASDLLFVLRNYFPSRSKSPVRGCLRATRATWHSPGPATPCEPCSTQAIPTPCCKPTCSREPRPCCLASSSTIPMRCSPHLRRSS